ncbi:MgtC/SapB family protein [Paracoccus benzoatiresistens]|uniref:Protein MgtC n=1 Tax=Paracoccus benzoatiresistens TaxID=2997341 RepID=A0ABT4J403_9RHOB|nr:MgtC/SapB family protein [Paracoccus sp. EF6]MCZ0961848.1 MgtC/SapB family protein [Paracoccus sp. EF6]
MTEIQDLFQPLQSIPLPGVAMRLGLAVVLGAMIGWKREISARAAGLRTHMLISLSAAMFTIVAMELSHFPADEQEMPQTAPCA